MGIGVRRALVVGAVLGVGLCPLPSAGESTSAPAPAAAVAPPGPEEVVVDELVVQVDDPATGRAGPAVDPAQDDTLVADRALGGGRVATEVVDTTDHQTIGVTWPPDEPGEELAVQIRTRTGGTWSPWAPMPVSDAAPDAGTADELSGLTRDGTDPVWIGEADAVQLSVVSGADADDVRLVAIGSQPASLDGTAEPARSAVLGAGAPLAAAAPASAPAPTMVTRAQWGAAAPSCAMDTAARLVGAVLHHTAGSNSYATPAAAMQQIRNDQRYHMQSRGWCDLGYNFVVDKWGTVYEGRAGSVTSPVVGVHAGGFNTGTVGVSLLGDYSTLTPPPAVVTAVAQVVGWKLGGAGVDPTGSMSYATKAGENSRFVNQTVTLPRVFAHRDVAYTACPGAAAYAVLPAVRTKARATAPIFAGAQLSRTSMPPGGSVTVTASPTVGVDWTLTVTDQSTGAVVWTTTGRTSANLSATWDGRGPAGAAGVGAYRVTLTGKATSDGAAAHAWSVPVSVTWPQDPPVVAAVPLGADLGFVAVTPARLLDTRTAGVPLGQATRLDLKVAGVSGVPANAKAVALNVTAVDASARTFIRAWPAGSPEPGTSMLNVDPSATSAAATVLGVGGEGKVSLRNNVGSVHLVVDVTGYYTGSGGAKFTPLATAARLVDTRTDAGLASGSTRRVSVASAGVPADATAVVINVTSASARSGGHIVVVPAGGDTKATSTVNHRIGGDVANRATVPLSGGKIDVYLHGGPAGVVIDVVGWYGPSGRYLLTPLVPQRLVDTRVGTPVGPRQARAMALRTKIVTAKTPAAALVTLTATGQTAPATYLTIGAKTMPVPPRTSDLNTGAGRDQAALAVLVWDSAGMSVVYNNVGSTHVVIDVTAVFR